MRLFDVSSSKNLAGRVVSRRRVPLYIFKTREYRRRWPITPGDMRQLAARGHGYAIGARLRGKHGDAIGLPHPPLHSPLASCSFDCTD
jgi:hypothetical protein